MLIQYKYKYNTMLLLKITENGLLYNEMFHKLLLGD